MFFDGLIAGLYILAADDKKNVAPKSRVNGKRKAQVDPILLL